MSIKPKPIIEVSPNPNGMYGGKKGCWRVRLADQHTLHDAGDSVDRAVDNLLTNLPRFDRSGDKSHYKIDLIWEKKS